MRIDQLEPRKNNPGAKTSPKRLGRGIGSGLGKTSGKGHKGQWARSGGGVRPGFEGGQMPLIRRLPKFGFDNAWKKIYSIINIGDLEQFEDGSVVDIELLHKERLVGKVEKFGLKVLGGGVLTKKLTIKAAKFTKSALDAIEKAGGKAEVV